MIDSRRMIRAAIIGVICFLVFCFFLVFPVWPRPRRHHRPDVMNNLHSLYVALLIYEQDEGAFPQMRTAADIKNVLYPVEIRDPSELVDPETKRPILPNP